MKERWPYLILLLPALALAFGIYVCVNTLNPESRWCRYQIYKQTNGTYEVWWIGRTKGLEASVKTYEDAKAFQAERCRSLKAFSSQKPNGEHIK